MVVSLRIRAFNMYKNIYLESQKPEGLNKADIKQAVIDYVKDQDLKKVLLLPPDFTRFHSNAGFITNVYYHYFLEHGITVHILPALGTHEAMTKVECDEMYGDIPYEAFIYHNWREDVVEVGQVPESYVRDITEGLWEKGVTLETNKIVMDPSYDLILSIGQVVPHEVIGMANHAKNVFVGCGGKTTIHQTHMIGAVFGMERMMGKDHTPVRKVLDYGMEHFLKDRPIHFVLTVTTAPHGEILTHGLYLSKDRSGLNKAIVKAQEMNIDFLDKGIKKCIVYLDPKEFKSTWLGNKSVYRTRMAIADGGELIVLAEGVNKFGEDKTIDALIRKYGYAGRIQVLEWFKDHEDLQQNMSAAAHLIHGSSDGRFNITYAVKNLPLEEVRGARYQAAHYDEVVKKYDPHKLVYGWNILDDGEEVFFIPNPALGLWIDKNRF